MVEVSSASYDPTFIETEFTLVDLTNGEELARKRFPANRSACAEDVYPDTVETSGWIGDEIAKHQRGAK